MLSHTWMVHFQSVLHDTATHSAYFDRSAQEASLSKPKRSVFMCDLQAQRDMAVSVLLHVIVALGTLLAIARDVVQVYTCAHDCMLRDFAPHRFHFSGNNSPPSMDMQGPQPSEMLYTRHARAVTFNRNLACIADLRPSFAFLVCCVHLDGDTKGTCRSTVVFREPPGLLNF
ncbi:uncharacterized protein LOC144109931 isoform X1 [Amblyomma americanum]